MFKLLSALCALVLLTCVGWAQQYPTQTGAAPCLSNCVQNCVQREARRCEQYCQQSCGQSAGQKPYGSIASNNNPIYLRPGSPSQAPNIPPYGKTSPQPAQPQNTAQPMESMGGTVSSAPGNNLCVQICMPSCTPQCTRQEAIAPGVNQDPSFVVGGGVAPMIPQGLGSAAPQAPVSLMPPQGAIGGTGSITAESSNPAIPQGPGSSSPQGSGPVTSSQNVQIMSQLPGIVPQDSGCLSACMSACSTQCAQQKLVTIQATESPLYSMLTSTNAPLSQNAVPTIQQPTNQCVPVCIPLCNAECTRPQPQPVPVIPERVPVQPQPTPLPSKPQPLVPLQKPTTECLPSTIGSECSCPRGFTVCVTVSGSNQCCRLR